MAGLALYVLAGRSPADSTAARSRQEAKQTAAAQASDGVDTSLGAPLSNSERDSPQFPEHSPSTSPTLGQAREAAGRAALALVVAGYSAEELAAVILPTDGVDDRVIDRLTQWSRSRNAVELERAISEFAVNEYQAAAALEANERLIAERRVLLTLAAGVELLHNGSVPTFVLREDVNVGLEVIMQSLSELPSEGQSPLRLAVARRAISVASEPQPRPGLSPYAKMLKQYLHLLRDAGEIEELRSAVEEWKRVDWPRTPQSDSFRDWHGRKLLEARPAP
jgi:hypothetical protein